MAGKIRTNPLDNWAKKMLESHEHLVALSNVADCDELSFGSLIAGVKSMVQRQRTKQMQAVEEKNGNEPLETLIPRLFVEHDGDHEAVARALGIPSRTLYNWRRELFRTQIVPKDGHKNG